MNPRIAFLTLVIFACPALAAEDKAPKEDPKEELSAFTKAHAVEGKEDLGGFTAELTLRSATDPKVMAIKDKVRFAYSWMAPKKEDFAMMDLPGSLQGPIRTLLRGIWRDITGRLTIDQLDGPGEIQVSREAGKVTFRGRRKGLGEVTLVFEESPRKMVSLHVKAPGGQTLAFAYEFKKKKDRLFISARDVIRKGSRQVRISYEGFRLISSFRLPMVVTLLDEKGKATSFNIRYVTVNGRAAVLGAVEEDEIREAVAELKKNWRRWDDLEKTLSMRKLSCFDHDLASDAIARYGLSDREPVVRVEAAKLLGQMGRRNVVPRLLKAMKPNEKTFDVYGAVIAALGHIGDPRAVPSLAKGWWNQKGRESAYGAARAKIDALGDIRCRASVDAILDIFYMAPDHALGPVAANLLNSLRKLTGQNFGRNRRAWKDWWKKNRGTYRFE
jgi:hypothetical protein